MHRNRHPSLGRQVAIRTGAALLIGAVTLGLFFAMSFAFDFSDAWHRWGLTAMILGTILATLYGIYDEVRKHRRR